MSRRNAKLQQNNLFIVMPNQLHSIELEECKNVKNAVLLTDVHATITEIV